MKQALESQLAHLGFQLVPPSPLLSPYVRSYWYVRRVAPLFTYHEEYMHPRGGFGIVFNFGDDLAYDARVINEPLFLDGANTLSRKLGFRGRIDMMGVQFHEGGAFPLLGVPLHELLNETNLLGLLGKAELMDLHGRLYEARTTPARVALLETWLMCRLSSGQKRHRLIPTSLEMLRQEAGNLRLSEFFEKLLLSQRQVERLYQREVGMSPKQYLRLLRITNARSALKQRREETTARLAVELGFYDQAHFIREFRAVVGMTPSAYIKRHEPRRQVTT